MTVINDDFVKTFAPREELANYLRTLSTAARFFRFATDFRKAEGYQLNFTTLEQNGELFVRLSLRDACECMSGTIMWTTGRVSALNILLLGL